MRDGLSPRELSVCDREPITRLERIQSFGFLLELSNEWVIVKASANLKTFLGIDAAAALGSRLDGLIDPEALHDIRNRMTIMLSSKGAERLYGVALLQGQPPFDIAVHYADSMIILEGERSSVDHRGDTASLVRAMVMRLSAQATLAAFHRDAARQVRALTGFDRVMIYRFDQQGDGEVIAESLAGGTDSFLGLHYPASDIPVQARALYLRNTFRVIADTGAATVPLLGLDSDAEPLDQSMAFTRAVSPVHIEYLRNMGVAASLSVSIVVDGELWGLIACHHRGARLPSFVVRTATELFGQMYSLKLELRERRADAELGEKVHDLVGHLVESIAGQETLLGSAAWWRTALVDVIDCDGVAVAVQGHIDLDGATPGLADVEATVRELEAIGGHRILAFDNLSALRPEAAMHAEVAAGVLAIPVTRSPRKYLLLFRRERIQDIAWGGNPDKSMIENGDGQLSPRKSFEAFRKKHEGQCLPFSGQTRRAAQSLRAALIEAMLLVSQLSDEERARTSERQELLIAELNHRVRNILGLVRGLINQPGAPAGDVARYVESLNGRVQALARAHDQITHVNWGPGRLRVLVAQEVHVYISDQSSTFALQGPEVLLHPQAFSSLALVFHELVTNSVKYGSLSAGGGVSVSLELRSGEGLDVKWRESGGPPVHMPVRRGFGSVIIERVVPFDLKGRAEVRYEMAGLEADFFIPQEHIATDIALLPKEFAEGGPGVTLLEDASERGRPLEGMQVLLVEDNLILALDTEDLLLSLGAKTVLLASSIEGARHTLDSQPIDFALLDVHVGIHTSLEFASAVRDAGIPYVFATGYGENVKVGAAHSSALVVSKPYGRLNVIAVITQALSTASHTAQARC